ncbi:MAG: aconitate hydratase AcnA [Chloroflexota bacterium]|nr:aconitate hydratase AcnA [Chloroflexota bacterium]
MTTSPYHLGARSILNTPVGDRVYYSLPHLEIEGLTKLDRLPFSIRVLLENALRSVDGYLVEEEDVAAVASWKPKTPPERTFPFMLGRVLMQDLTGIPAVVDLAAMRSAMARMGGDPQKINPLVPVDLVIDHSVQVDYFGTSTSLQQNVEREYQRNQERYSLLRWAQGAFKNFRLVPPGAGIVHQVNLEYLADVVTTRETEDGLVLSPDTVIGTDSHTTMINGLGVLGWGVGGIEAEAVLLGQPYYMQVPEVIGVKLTGALKEGVTATDMVLTLTQILRARGVVEKFVEFFGSGLSNIPLADRATVANMSPEYGATCGYFPIDDITLDYLRDTGRDENQVRLVELYSKAQNLFRTDSSPDPEYTDVLHFDLGNVESSLSGPRLPNERVAVGDLKRSFRSAFPDQTADAGENIPLTVDLTIEGDVEKIGHGSVVIAAITSCTNTSNPSVVIGAGLLAKKAVESGLTSKPWVKTSLAPGSQVVTDYLDAAGLTPSLEALGFNTVGYGCTSCIGNSGPVPEPVSNATIVNDLVAVSVLSGNRNFEGRIHPLVKANYLASPGLVVAYAIAGTVDINLETDPLGTGKDGQPVYLRDVWPSQKEVADTIGSSLSPAMFRSRYDTITEGSATWKAIPAPTGALYQWNADSTYIQEAPYFLNLKMDVDEPEDIKAVKVLAVLGDSITTDHISPAGAIPEDRPAGQYLLSKGVPKSEFNIFGSRRGNHEVMARGTFGNIRLRNALTPDKEGDWSLHQPGDEVTSIYDAAQKYIAEGVPTIILAGKEYGSGSSRDWAAKGPNLLGVQAVVAESYERIHRNNLVGMGVMPLQFKPGESVKSLGLTGKETYEIIGISEGISPGQNIQVQAVREDGTRLAFDSTLRIDNQVEVDYYKQGGVLHTVLRRLLKGG